MDWPGIYPKTVSPYIDHQLSMVTSKSNAMTVLLLWVSCAHSISIVFSIKWDWLSHQNHKETETRKRWTMINLLSIWDKVGTVLNVLCIFFPSRKSSRCPRDAGPQLIPFMKIRNRGKESLMNFSQSHGTICKDSAKNGVGIETTNFKGAPVSSQLSDQDSSWWD